MGQHVHWRVQQRPSRAFPAWPPCLFPRTTMQSPRRSARISAESSPRRQSPRILEKRALNGDSDVVVGKARASTGGLVAGKENEVVVSPTDGRGKPGRRAHSMGGDRRPRRLAERDNTVSGVPSRRNVVRMRSSTECTQMHH